MFFALIFAMFLAIFVCFRLIFTISCNFLQIMANLRAFLAIVGNFWLIFSIPSYIYSLTISTEFTDLCFPGRLL